MASTEQPPVPQQERQPQSPENAQTTSSTGDTALERLRALIRKNGDLRPLKDEFNEQNCILDGEKQKTAKELRNDLRKVVESIQRPASARDAARLPSITETIIKQVKLTDISSESAPVIYELLRISSEGSGYDFNTPEGMVKALDAMLAIAPFEPTTARKIIEAMVEDAHNKGCDDQQLKKATEYLHPHQVAKTDIKRRREERELQYQTALAPIKGVVLGDVAEERIRLSQTMLSREAVASGQMTSEEVERIIQDRIAVETNNVQGEILGSLNYVVSSLGSQSEKPKAMGQYVSVLSRLRNEGKISQADFLTLQELPENSVFTEPIERMNRSMEGNDLVQHAMSVFVPSEQQIRLLRGISSAQSLEDLFASETVLQNGVPTLRYMNGNNINWDVFMKDVKGIFGELLSIADRNPNQFFDQAFNPMYEGHLYQVLLQRIKHLGTQIEMRADSGEGIFAHAGDITIVEQIADPTPPKAEPPFRMVVHKKETKHSFSEAVGQYLANNMSDYKHVREHLHNINAISTQGLGWEQLKQYSERLGLERLDRLVRQEEDLSLAANFYSAALQQEVASNGRVTMTQFGQQDEVWQLNSAERIAFFQMKAHLAKKHPELSQAALNQQSIQKIRMAAAISYGLTGEFWNIMLTARLPMESGKTVSATGETINYITPSYVGTEHRGYEKMIGELDLDMVLQRFGLPKFYNDLRYCTRYRDLKDPPGVYSRKGYYQHGLAMEARSENENALVNGRSDRLIEMDEQYVYFMDYMRTKCIGLFSRAGWRFTNWEASIEYQPNTTQINHAKTLEKVRQMGSYLTKRYLETIKSGDIDAMTREDVFALTGIQNKSGSQLNADERKLFGTRVLYERVLFDQIGRVSPTKFVQLQERRWTPRGEKMLRDSLVEYLTGRLGNRYPKEILNSHIYNMYLSALTLAEKSTWLDRRERDQNYIFGATDIDAHRDELVSYFKQYAANFGTHDEYGKNNIQIDHDSQANADEFIEILKGFQEELTRAINLPRNHNENGTGPRESLQQRFAEMLSTTGPASRGEGKIAVGAGDSKGNIENLIAGDDFDMEHFYFNAAGGYGSTRMTGETFEVTSKVNPALKAIIMDVLPDLVKGQYRDIGEFEKAIKEKLVKPFKDIHAAIAIMDKNQADEYCISLAVFVANMIGKDRVSRIKGFGTVVDFFKRQRYGTQSSMYQEYYPNTLQNPSHALDSDEIYAMNRIICRALNIAASEKIPDHLETTFSLFGRPLIQKMVYKGEKWEKKKLFGFLPYKKRVIDESSQIMWSEKDLQKASGLTGGTKWIETYIPAIGATLFLLLIAMAYLANQKNKKK